VNSRVRTTPCIRIMVGETRVYFDEKHIWILSKVPDDREYEFRCVIVDFRHIKLKSKRATGYDIISSILIARVSVEPTALVKHIICCDENVLTYPCADASKATGLRTRGAIRGSKHHQPIWNSIYGEVCRQTIINLSARCSFAYQGILTSSEWPLEPPPDSNYH